MEDGKLTEETQSPWIILWRRTTGEQKVLFVALIIFIIYVTVDGRTVPNVQITQACNQNKTICQDIPITIYKESAQVQVPNAGFSLTKAIILSVLLGALVRSFYKQTHYGDIDLEEALRITKDFCRRMNYLKDTHGEYKINKKGHLQHKHYLDGSKPFKWITGVNFYKQASSVASKYFVVLIDYKTGNIIGLKENIYDGFAVEFDGTEKTYWDERPVTSPVLKEATAAAAVAGIKPVVQRQR